MSCDFITNGRGVQCNDGTGGLAAIYFIENGTLSGVTKGTDDEVTDFGGNTSAYKFDLREFASDFNAAPVYSNGQTYYTHTVNVVLKKLDKVTTKAAKLLGYSNPHIVVEDMQGNAYLLGQSKGMEMTGGSFGIGAGMGDANGYTMNFTRDEKEPFLHLADAVEGNPFAGLGTATVTIVTS